MTQTTWDPSTNNGLALSNNNLTATGVGSNGGIIGDYGTTPVTAGQKVYFEVGTDGFYPGSGFTIGVAHHGWDWNTDRYDNGVLSRTDPAPSSADDLTVHWDGIVDEGGSWISNPHRIVASMQLGGTLDFAVDTVNHKLWWRSSLSGQWDENPNDNPATNTGGIDISPLGGAPLYPVVTDWTGAGAAATINGGTVSFRDSVPAGFTALDNLGGGSSGGGSSGGGSSGGGSSGGGSSGGGSSGGGSPGGSTVTLGSGSDTLALQISEDAWNGDAQFTISVDGQQIGGTQTATALHAAGQEQTFNVLGSFGSGNHNVSINFINDAFGGTPTTDRNLYVDGATIDGNTVPGATFTEYSNGSRGFSFSSSSTPPQNPASVTIGSGRDTLALQVSEDAWNGDAKFTVSVDGRQIDGTQTATALHAAGQTQTFNVLGNFGAGTHTVSVNFTNDAYGGTPTTDRNLYVAGATIDGNTVPGATFTEYSQGPHSFSFVIPSS